MTGRPRPAVSSMIGVAALVLAGGAVALPAHAATVTEDFSSAPDATIAPPGWSIDNDNTAGMRPGWEGWTFHEVSDVVDEFGTNGNHAAFTKADGTVAVVQSDANRPADGRFDSTLWSAPLSLEDHSGAVTVRFDSHYRQGQNPPAVLLARVDDGAPQTIDSFSRDRLNEAVEVTFDVPAGAEEVTIGWAYLDSNNNWYWMIDDVEILESAPADVEPVVTSAAKPLAAPGSTIEVTLEGLRDGQQVEAALEGEAVEGIPAAVDGTVAFAVNVPADASEGVLALEVDGEGIVPFTIPVTVLEPGETTLRTTEPQLWTDGFDGSGDAWETTGEAWATSTLADVVDEHGTDRRQAFTRASGEIAVADAADAALDGTLTSESIAVTGGDALELRFDSHYRARSGEQSGVVTAVFDGERAELYRLTDADEESAQPRVEVEVPEGASSVRFEFAFASEAGGGSWMIDDVQLVRPLPSLAADAEVLAAIDVFSDIQGSQGNDALANRVLPGFAGMTPRASTIVANGDLVSQGYQNQYDAFFEAFEAGGGDDYDQAVFTIGNHETYGSGTGDEFVARFLANTDARATGGNGGLWGETLVDDRLPLLWIGTEGYEYSEKTGAGPFFEMSDEQFEWLRGRLDHWQAENRPVVLFTHQVFASSVSGTYIDFNSNDYGDDTARVEALLSGYPNVTIVTSHTHWSPTLNDWSVEQRFDPRATHAPTIINTGALTTQYGPSGDWGETGIAGDPTALRAVLYEDRLRVTAYEFAADAAPHDLKHVDIALPVEDPVDPGGDPDDDDADGGAGGSDGSDGLDEADGSDSSDPSEGAADSTGGSDGQNGADAADAAGSAGSDDSDGAGQTTAGTTADGSTDLVAGDRMPDTGAMPLGPVVLAAFALLLGAGALLARRRA